MKYVDTDEYPYVPRARERKTKRKSRSLSVILREIQRMEGRLVYHSCDAAQVQTTQVGLHGMLKSAMRKHAPGIYLVQLDGFKCGRITLVDEHFLKRIAVLLRDAYAHRASIDLQQGDFDAWLRRGRRRHRFLEQVQQRMERPDLFVEGHACWLADDAQRPSKQPVEQVYNRLTALAAGRRHQPLAAGDPWVDWHHLGRTLDRWPFDLLAHVPLPRDQMPRLLMLCQKHELNTPEVAVVVEELLLINQKIDVLDFLDHLALLIEGAQRLPQELDRRLGLLAKAIFYALGEECLYIRKPSAPILPNGCASCYLNSAVLENILTYFAREYPEMKVFAKEEHSWQGLVLRLFGLKVSKDWGTWEVVLPVDPQFDQLNFLLSQMKKKFPQPKDMVLNKWTGMLSLQAARLAGLTGDTSTPMALSLWLGTCRAACAPGSSGVDALQLCIFTNKGALESIGDNRASAAAYLRILNYESDHLLERLYQEIGDSPQTVGNYIDELTWNKPMFAVFANPLFHSRTLKELTDKTCFLWLVWVDQKQPDRLQHYVDWMKPAYHTEYGLCSFWAEIFVYLKPEVRAIFINLWHTLEGIEGVTERQRGMVVHAIAMAAYEGKYSIGLLRAHRAELLYMARVLLASVGPLQEQCGDDYQRTLKVWGSVFMTAVPSTSLWMDHFPEQAENIGPCLVDYFNGWLLKGLKNAQPQPPVYPLWHAGYLMLVRLGGGDFNTYHALVEAHRKDEFELSKVVDGWDVLRRHSGLQQLLVVVIAQANLRKRACSLIGELPRLEDHLGRRSLRELLHDFDNCQPHAELPRLASENFREPLRKLAAFREIIGEDPIPASLLKVLKTRTIYEGEVRALHSGERSENEEIRLHKLRGWLADPAYMEQRIEQEFFKRYVKAVRVDSLAALEHVLRDRMQQHWRVMGFLGREADNVADWDHAMKFHGEIDSNQRIFRRLLRACAAGDPAWVQRHTVNQRFVEEMKGRPTGKIKRWLQHFEIKQRVGASTWRVYTEEDPLQVLKMGTYFDTCLSWDGCNAHSAVANAVEINKRVLYVHNGKSIVGRRLLVLTRSGQLLGFYTYSSDAEAPEYVKILLDQLCWKMAEETGYALVKDVTPFDEAEDHNKDIRLFANWYYDCGEDYDAWVHLGAHPSDMPLSELEQRVRAAKTADDLEPGWVRFLIAAGAKARPLAEKLGKEQVLNKSQLETVVQHLKVIS